MEILSIKIYFTIFQQLILILSLLQATRCVLYLLTLRLFETDYLRERLYESLNIIHNTRLQEPVVMYALPRYISDN